MVPRARGVAAAAVAAMQLVNSPCFRPLPGHGEGRFEVEGFRCLGLRVSGPSSVDELFCATVGFLATSERQWGRSCPQSPATEDGSWLTVKKKGPPKNKGESKGEEKGSGKKGEKGKSGKKA